MTLKSSAGFAWSNLLWYATPATAAIYGAYTADQSLNDGWITDKVLNAIVYFFSKMGADALSFLMSKIGTSFNLDMSFFNSYFGFVQRWIPVSYGFALLFLYWNLYLGITAIRWGMKFIPFINAG